MIRIALLSIIVVLGVLAGVAGAHTTGSARANHANTEPDWVYFGTWRNLYPQKTGTVTWRAWTVDSQPVPSSDALRLIDALNNNWEPILDYILGSMGIRQYSFTAKAYNYTSANATYVRMNTDAQVTFVCGGTTVTACWAFTNTTTLSGSYPSLNGRKTATKVTIPYGPAVYSGPWAPGLTHTFAHEWGHGLGLEHHNNGCETVMSNVSCTNMPSAADGQTVIQTVYGY